MKIKDATGKGISAISGKMKELGTKVVIPVAIAAATATTAVVGASVSEGAKLEQSRGGVETLFKDDADTVKANADKAFETAGLSANDYMEQVTSFSASLLNSLRVIRQKRPQWRIRPWWIWQITRINSVPT